MSVCRDAVSLKLWSESGFSLEPQDVPPASSSLRDIDWSREQLEDRNVTRVKNLVESGFCPEYSDLRIQPDVVLKYLRE